MLQPLRPDEERVFEAEHPEVLVLACGAIAREVLAVIRLNGWTNVDRPLPPGELHSRPERIAPAVDAKLRELDGRYERVFVAYADCGTGGALDSVLEQHGVERLPGDHCYGFLTGNAAWEELHDAEPATFYLTDFLARHFDAIVDPRPRARPHPELLPQYFGNYRRLLYLAQTEDESSARGRARRPRGSASSTRSSAPDTATCSRR